MKTILGLILIAVQPLLARADLSVRGEVLQGPATISVRAETGAIRIYKAPANSKKVGFIAEDARSTNKSLRLAWGRKSAGFFDKGCGTSNDYLGQLVAPVTLDIHDDQGQTEALTILAASAAPNGNNFTPGNVRVYGNCKDAGDQLSGVSIVTTLVNAKLQ